MKKFDTYLTESIVDIPKNNLDPTVFDFPDDDRPPYLKPAVKKQIMEDVDKFADIVGINRFYVVGSILTKHYSERSDIDVTIEVFKEEVDDVLHGKLLTLIKLLNGKLATGTTHPINYYILLDKPDEDRFDAMYDVPNDRWLKEPQNVQVNVSEYINNFQKVVSTIDLAIAQLRRDIIDYDTLSTFNSDEIANLRILLKRKLIEITEKIETLADIRNAIVRKKKKSYIRPMSPEEIKQFKTKTHLPETIIDKMLQRYYYWDFIKKLEAILADKDVLTPEDIDDIKKVDKQACLKTFESFAEKGDSILIQEKIRKIKLRKVDWKNPHAVKKSFMHLTNRGMDRQNLRQVPQSQRVDKRMVSTSNIGSAKKIIEVAKKAPSGIWRITPTQVQWLAAKYHHIPPNASKNIKHLGNTGIMVWRKDKNVFYLVKPSRHFLGHH
jgi:predicted nucleotidyltransferase